jgi:site-specific DNA recombinase
MTLRAVIYARVSSAGQRERHTIGSQIAELPAHVKREGWALVETFVDDGISGETVEARPGFQRVLELAEDRAFNVLVVIDLDRITRAKNSAEGAFIYDTLRECKVKISVPGQGIIDLEDEDQDFFVGLKREIAKWEKRKILRRTARGKRDALRVGKRYGSRDPYGLVWVKDDTLAAGGTYQLEPQEAAIIRRMVHLSLSGMGVAQIIWTLNQEGIRHRPTTAFPQGNRWHETPARTLLRSTTIKGDFQILRKTEGRIIKVPPVIDAETWSRLQASLDGRLRRGRPVTTGEYLLKGIARCGVCGYGMWVVRKRPGVSKTEYYRCLTINRWRSLGLEGPCGNTHHNVIATDAAVWDEVRKLLSSPSLVEEARALASKGESSGETWRAQMAGCTRRLSDLEGLEAEVLGRRRRGLLSAVACDRELEAIARERTISERSLAVAQQHLADLRGGAERLREREVAYAELTRQVETADFERRVALVRLVTSPPSGAVRLHADGSVELRGIDPDEILLDFGVPQEKRKFTA